MVTIKKRAGVIPYSFSYSIALLSSLLSCSFYLLDLRTISSGTQLLFCPCINGLCSCALFGTIVQLSSARALLCASTLKDTKQAVVFCSSLSLGSIFLRKAIEQLHLNLNLQR